MEKLADPSQFFALQAVERFVSPELFAVVDLDDPKVLGGEQQRAQDVLRWWISLQD